MAAQRSAEPNNEPAVSGYRNHLQGVARALRLLNDLAAAGSDGLSLTEASREVQATKSATLALLRTLIDYDYVTAFGRGPRYRLGPAVVHLAQARRESVPWIDIASPIARELTEECGWTSRLASHIDGRPVFEHRVDAPGVIRFFTPLGVRELPHVSAAGKAILACLPENEVRRIVHETGLPRRTEHTITDVGALLKNLKAISVTGFAVDDEEDDEGVICVAAAFAGQDGAPLGAISITGLKSDPQAHRVADLGPLVRRAADRIAVGIGGHAWISG